MAPFDSGFIELSLGSTRHDADDPVKSPEFDEQTKFQKLGAYLRSWREYLGWDIDTVASATNIRGPYLVAIEQGDMTQLPLRPFVVGYVKTYAKILGLDPDLIITWFDREFPGEEQRLHSPVGAEYQDYRRKFPGFLIYVGILIIAVAAWSLLQRTLVERSSAEVISQKGVRAVNFQSAGFHLPQGQFVLSPPLRLSSEAAKPAPYITPGLEAVVTPVVSGATTTQLPLTDEIPLGTAFEARGTVYDPSKATPSMLLQARRSAGLIVRLPDGQVYFARQMRAGEALRAPIGYHLSIETTDPEAFYIFESQKFIGKIQQPRVALDQILKTTAE